MIKLELLQRKQEWTRGKNFWSKSFTGLAALKKEKLFSSSYYKSSEKEKEHEWKAKQLFLLGKCNEYCLRIINGE